MNPFLSRRIPLVLCAFSAALLSPAAHAQNSAPKAPTAWKPAPLFPASSLSQKNLPNGVSGVVRETRDTGLVSVQVWVNAGSRQETQAESGAAHLVEALALRASKNYPRAFGALNGGVADAIAVLGGDTNSLTSRDSTFYAVTVNAAFLPQALRALGDAVLYPVLSDSAIEEAKISVLTAQQLREADPLSAAADLAYRAAFAKHPYAKAAGGSVINIETMPSQRVREFYARQYVGRNLSVIVTGDVRAEQAHLMIANNFGAAPKATKAAPTIAPEPVNGAEKQIVRQRAINRTALALAFPSPGIKNVDDVIAIDVLLAMWREGPNANLRRALLDPRNGKVPNPDADPSEDQNDGDIGNAPLALGYDVDFLTQRDPGLFIVTMAIEPTDRREAVEAIFQEIARVANGVPSADVARAKRALTQQYIQQGETVAGQAGALGFYDNIDTYRFAVEYLPRIERITSADLQRVAKTYLTRTRSLQCVIEPLPQAPTPNAPDFGSGVITAQLPGAQNNG